MSSDWASVGESLTPQWEAGIDWLTYIADTPGDAARLIGIAAELRDAHQDPTAKKRPFKLGGYIGWQQGGVRLGLRGHSALCQISGTIADGHATRLASLSGRPTRLDVQMTWLLPTAQPSWWKQHLELSSQTRSLPPSRRPCIGSRMDTRGLRLGTAGDRTEPRYLRVYDKGVETDTYPPGRLWRLELEAKGTLAPRLWDSLIEAQDRSQWCFNTLCAQWRLLGLHWPWGDSTPPGYGITAQRKPRSDSDALALWLVRSVKPAIARLLKTHSRDEIRRLLDLDWSDDLPPT